MKTYIIIISFVLVLIGLVKTGLSGQEIAKNNSEKKYKEHRVWVVVSYLLTIISIYLVETYVREKGGSDFNLELIFHLFFAIGYLSLMIFVTVKNGFKKPIVHKKYVYLVFVFYILTFITGMYLLLY